MISWGPQNMEKITWTLEVTDEKGQSTVLWYAYSASTGRLLDSIHAEHDAKLLVFIYTTRSYWSQRIA
jgi:hypothetical protein